VTGPQIEEGFVWRVNDDGVPVVLASLMTAEVVFYNKPVPSLGGFPFTVLPGDRPSPELTILWDDGQRVEGITVPSYPWHRHTSAIELFWMPLARLDELADFVKAARR
jgi:hypothetical protein